MRPNFGKPSIYAQQYFCNKTHLKTMGKKRKLQKIIIMQVFIALLVGKLRRQWIYPGHHRVRLSIGSTKIFVHLHTRKDSKVTDVCLRCGDERIYQRSFFNEVAFLLKHRSMPGEKPIPWWMHKFIANTMSQDSIPYVVASVRYDGLCKRL